MEILETEVIDIFYPAFKRAVKKCCIEGRTIKIITHVPTKTNSYLVKVGATDPIDFYFLGVKFGVYRSEI